MNWICHSKINGNTTDINATTVRKKPAGTAYVLAYRNQQTHSQSRAGRQTYTTHAKYNTNTQIQIKRLSMHRYAVVF